MHFCVHIQSLACMHAFRGMEVHIDAFKGRDSENNKAILETLAINPSLIKWDIYKLARERTEITQPTVSRRVDDLRERGYIIETAKRRTRVGNREEDSSCYGLTRRGFIASLMSDQIRDNILAVIEKNPQLKLGGVLSAAREIFTDEEIETMAQGLVDAIKLTPVELESTDEADLIWYIFPALRKVNFLIPEKDWSKLRDSKLFRDYVLGLEPKIQETLEGIRRLRQWRQAIETPRQSPSSDLPLTSRDEQAMKTET